MAKKKHKLLCVPSNWVDTIATKIQAGTTGHLKNFKKKRNVFVDLAYIVDPKFCLKKILEENHNELKKKLAAYLDEVVFLSSAPKSSSELQYGPSASQTSTLFFLPKKQKVMKKTFYKESTMRHIFKK